MDSLIYFALWAGLFFLMMRFGCGAHIMGHRHRHHGSDDKHAQRNSERMRWVPPETDVDPVCRKSVRTALSHKDVSAADDLRQPNFKPPPSPLATYALPQLETAEVYDVRSNGAEC